MSRGVTLHEKEMRQVFELMKKRRMENRFKRDGFERSVALDKDEEPLEAPLVQQAPAELPADVTDQAEPDLVGEESEE